MMATEKPFEYWMMVAFYRLFAQHAILKVYRMPEPVRTLYSLGVAPFSSGFLSNLLDTIGLPAKHVFSGCPLLHNQPSLDLQLFFPADYEYFHFLSAYPCYYDDMYLEYGQIGGWFEIA